jgi:hypothetical protein
VKLILEIKSGFTRLSIKKTQLNIYILEDYGIYVSSQSVVLFVILNQVNLDFIFIMYHFELMLNYYEIIFLSCINI